MDILYDITIGLASSLIYFLLGIIAHKIFLKIQAQYRSIIWKNFNNHKKLAIRLSLREGPRPTSTHRTSVAEVTSIATLFPIFRQLNIETEIVTDHTDNVIRHYDNILSVGGPAANDITAWLVKKYSNVWPLKIVTDPVGFEVGSKKYEPLYSEDGTVLVTDYGLLALFQENRGEKNQKNLMMAMGCRGFGTQGCINSLQSKALVRIYKKYRCPKSFVAIVKVDIDNGSFHTHVVEFFPLLTD